MQRADQIVMAVLRLVVDRRAALHHLLQAAASKVSPGRAARQTSSASVSAARPSPSAMRIKDARASASSGSALPSMCLGAGEQLFDRAGVERLEHQDAGARQQRRNQFKRRILGGRADQHDGAVLHHRQEGILLGAVEAVNFVDEEQRALPGLTARPRRIEHLFQIGDAGKDRRYLLEIKLGRVGQKPRHGRLAGPGRPPENQRAERSRLQHAGERAVGAEKMVLPDDVGELVAAAACRQAAVAHHVRGPPRRTGLVPSVWGRELIRKTSPRSAARPASIVMRH